MVYDYDDVNEKEEIGKTEFELGNVVSHLSRGLTIDIKQKGKTRGKLKVKATKNELEHFEYYFDIKVDGVKDIEVFSKTDPMVSIFAPASKDLTSKNFTNCDWVERHVTEWVKDDLNPNFKPFKIKVSRLNKGLEDAPLKWKLLDYSKKGIHDVVGELQLSISQLLCGQREFEFKCKKGKNVGRLIFQKFEKHRAFTLTDYINAGLHMSLCCAYDFTQANGEHGSDNYLHNIDSQQNNLYEKVTHVVGNILRYYDTDNMIPCYAFGFSAPNIGVNEIAHAYPLNGNFQLPHIKGFENIIPAYRQFAPNALPGSQCKLSPILNQAVGAYTAVYKQNKYLYNIMLFIMAGEVSDKQETIDAIKKARHLPLSIIIVALGDKPDNGFLHHLDDETFKEGRDIVQYVHFSKNSNLAQFGE